MLPSLCQVGSPYRAYGGNVLQDESATCQPPEYSYSSFVATLYWQHILSGSCQRRRGNQFVGELANGDQPQHIPRMSLSREPSQRALNWVRWNSSKTRPNSNNNSKRATEPEIVHLGGARVGTAFEVLELPAPDRSRPTERPLTQWTFNPPPPNPPGIGIAIASPDDSPRESPNAPNLDNDRPLTQWFPELQPEAAKNKNESQNLGLPSAYPYVNPSTEIAEGDLSSPLSLSLSSNANLSPPRAVSPLQSPISSPIDLPETNASRPVQFPKRSTSLSQSSRHAPPRLAKRAIGTSGPLRATEVQLRRTQSNAEVARPVELRILPHQTVSLDQRDGLQKHEVPTFDLKIQESQRSTRRSPKPLKIPQEPQVLPPLTSAPPNVPLPPISATKLAGQGKARGQLHIRGRSSSSDRSIERSPPREVQEQVEGQQSGTEQKLTSKERFWLHRHYRGEAMFLKAWGLEITSEEDREEGRRIMRELIEGEAQEERETQERQRMHHRSGSQSRSSTATSSSGRDGVGLDVIAEERLSREFHLHQTAQSPSYGNGAEDKFWRTEHDTRDQRLRNHPGSEKHSRNESTDSVLGQYLDLRLSRNG
ncbi:hypothetical protein F4801DRAFT_553855 [Xylaria longipes]|nr:hypothetical protein F4801DRAFT_553855 [Xylaria longipes]RYC61507.1 hypothetical protein CHU98_g4722 [Xylaria longipes]